MIRPMFRLTRGRLVSSRRGGGGPARSAVRFPTAPFFAGPFFSGLFFFGVTAGAGQERPAGTPAPEAEPPEESRDGADEEAGEEPGEEADGRPFAVFGDLTLGTEPQSADVTGQLGVPDDDYIPEVFQYRRRGAQKTQGEIGSGEHRSAALTELRVLDSFVEPGGTVRAIARVEPAFEKGRRFVAEFWSREYGRAAVVYVNFRPHRKDRNLYLGRGRVDRYHPGGRYDIGSTMITDEQGHKKAYSSEFNPVLRDPDGTPAHFVVADNPRADLTPPALVSFRVLTEAVGPGGTVLVEAFAEDDLAGPTQARAVFASPSGRRSVRADLIGDSRNPGRFLGAFSVPEWYEGGRWTARQVALYDAARNEALLFAATEPVLAGAAFHLAADPARRDDEPPTLLALELPQREARAGEGLPVAALVVDDRSGVEEVFVSFLSESGADLVRVALESRNPPLNRPSLVPQPNVFRGTLKIAAWRERGRYRVSRVNLADRARNYRNLNPARDEEVRGLEVVFLPEDEGKAPERAGAKPSPGRK